MSSGASHSRVPTQDDPEISKVCPEACDAELTPEVAPKETLNVIQASMLLTADCVGVGILALPEDVQVLGWVAGISFLVVNLPINWYAGTILAHAAAKVEEEDEAEGHETTSSVEVPKRKNKVDAPQPIDGLFRDKKSSTKDGIIRRKEKVVYSSLPAALTPVETDDASGTEEGLKSSTISEPRTENDHKDEASASHNRSAEMAAANEHEIPSSHIQPGDASTFDLIGMTSAVFHQAAATRFVLIVYWLNIFLVLGDYLLVMAHAVSALVGEDTICLPTAGIVASVLMFAVSQLNTMALLGKQVAALSLLVMLIVLVQCLVAAREHKEHAEYADDDVLNTSPSLLRRFAALGSIGFAVGSQKLFLNIRHEMKYRVQAQKTLGISLSAYGLAYVVVVILAGSDPPSFLFDAIPEGWRRRLAGLLLWIHVAVSYAINSQAICSSADRLIFHRIKWLHLDERPRRRWLVLTFGMATLSYLVANAIPFFKDLVALIGALTSVPLTLTLPALIHRKSKGIPLVSPEPLWACGSYFLFLYSLVFLAIGLAGALSSIDRDWVSHGRPFSCH